jgi:ankyrin repeat protein
MSEDKMNTTHSYSLSLARSLFRTLAAKSIAFLLPLTMATASAVSIHEAAKAGDAAGVRAILQTNAVAASLTNSLGETALHLGSGAASPAVVEALLAAKAPVNVQAQGNTALHYAILYRRSYRFAEGLGTTNIQELLEWSWKTIANPEIRTMAGGPAPVDLAALRRSLLESGQAEAAQTREELKVVELLLAAGAEPNAPNLIGMTPIHCAAWRPQPEFLKALLDQGGNVLAQTRTGETPLHYAATLGSPATVKLLLEKGAKVGKPNRFGNTPILFAAASGNLETARLLLERGAFADDRNNDGATPLHTAVCQQDREMVALLLDQGHAAINGRAGSLSETALQAAAGLGDAEMVRLLLEHKADVHATDKEGFTPLLNAAEKGHKAIIEILVEQGADLAARTQKDACAFALAAGSTNRLLLEWLAEKLPALDFKDKVLALQSAAMHGRLANVRWLLEKGVPGGASNAAGTPLEKAAGGPGMIARLRQQKTPALKSVGDEAGSEEDYAQIVSLLLTNGAAANTVGFEGRTPLHYATTCGSVLITEILLRHKADIQARTSFGKTPLHQAATWGDARLVELLLAHGAVIEAKDNDDFTPLRDAASAGNSATVKSLLAHGGVVSVRDRYGATPLHWAAMTTNVTAVALLLDAGADINALDTGKRTPLHQAVAAGRDAVVRLLLERKADATLRDAGFDNPADLARKKGFYRIATILSGQSTLPSKQRSE